MSGAYDQLLDATLQHLRDLKAHGTKFLPVSPQTLAGLAAPVPIRRPAPVQPPTSPVPVAAPKPMLSSMPKIVSAPKPVPSAAPRVSSLPPIPSLPPITREEKERAMAGLRPRVLACVKCPHLASSRTQVVFGVGDIHSPLMFVGEAPGADEDAQGEPFVGKAGQLLTKIIQTMGYDRDTVYIANILKCRPDTPGQTAGNRKPTPQEMETCFPWLMQQLDIIRPKVIVALGVTAMDGLFGKIEGIGQLRGRWQEFRGIPVMPTYHPAYLLRNQALSEKRKVWEDMLQVLEKLGAPISEKQRNYFLK